MDSFFPRSNLQPNLISVWFFTGNFTSDTLSSAVMMKKSSFSTISCPSMLWITSALPTYSQPSVSVLTPERPATLFRVLRVMYWRPLLWSVFQWFPTMWWLFPVRSWGAPCLLPTPGCVFLVSCQRLESCRFPETLWRSHLRLVAVLFLKMW